MRRLRNLVLIVLAAIVCALLAHLILPKPSKDGVRVKHGLGGVRILLPGEDEDD